MCDSISKLLCPGVWSKVDSLDGMVISRDETIKIKDTRISSLTSEVRYLNKQIESKDIELAALYYKVTPPSPPWPWIEVTGEALYGLLRDLLGNICTIDLADQRYRITTVSEFLRFMEWAQTWKMDWKEDFPDCDDFVRLLKGLLVCPGWGWIPPIDVWFERANGPHSEFLTLLIDNREGSNGQPTLFLIEPQIEDLIEVAEEVLVENGVSKAYVLNH